MKIFGIVGWSGTGKTTLITALLPLLCERGYLVSTIKHAHHRFDIDQPGKDSWRHREAGATEVMIASTHRWVLQHEIRDEAEPTMAELLTHMSPVDLVLIEGFKSDPIPKLELVRPSMGRNFIHETDPAVCAVTSFEPEDHPSYPVPFFPTSDTGSLVALILSAAIPYEGRA